MRCSRWMQRFERLERNVGQRLREMFRREKRRHPRPKASQFAQVAELLEERALLSALTVNSTADNTNADASLTLREAILLVNNAGDANAALGGVLTAEELAQIDATDPFGVNDTILFDANLAGGTILLNGTELPIAASVAINGLGANLLGIDAGLLSRIFNVDDGDGLNQIPVSISGLALTGGSSLFGGAINNLEDLTVANSIVAFNTAEFGGGIENSGTITVIGSLISQNFANQFGAGLDNFNGFATVINSTIAANTANLDGGGVYNNTITDIFNSRIESNTANRDGGGIFNSGDLSVLATSMVLNSAVRDGGGIENQALLTVTNSDLTLNGGGGNGGGLDNLGAATITGSTFDRNFALTDGGGIFNAGGLSLLNSTLTGNSAQVDGGGIDNTGTMALTNNTIVFNTATASGGGIAAGSIETLENTIIAGNTANAGGDISDLIETAASNLIGDPNSAGGILDGVNGNIVGNGNGGIIDITTVLDTVPKANGGFTLTHALVAGSLAIDAGDDALATNAGLTTDQRGFPFARIAGAGVDIGAYERQSLGLFLVVDTLQDENDGNFGPGDLSLREAIGLTNGSIGQDTITFDPNLAGGTIVLNGTEIAILDDVTITGLGDELLAVNANGLSRIFNISDGNALNQISVSISGLTFTGGSIQGDGGAIINRENLTVADSTLFGNTASGFSGAIDNFGTLDITNSLLFGNSAGLGGGAIDNFGTLTVTNSELSENTAGTSGGAISNRNGGTLTITNSTLSSNIAQQFGGAVFNGSKSIATIEGVLTHIHFNSALDGGGVENFGTLLVSEASIANNTAERFGGGIDNFQGTVTLQGGVVAFNQAFDGGGIENIQGTLTVTNSSVSQNFADRYGGGIDNFQGTVTLQGGTVALNFAGQDGGGIENIRGTLIATGTFVSDNVAGNLGGGIDNFFGELLFENSFLVNNSAAFGGGLSNITDEQTAVIRNSGLFQNQASGGGGILNDGDLLLTESTLLRNTADFGGGILSFDRLTLFGSTLSLNTAVVDGGGVLSIGATEVTNSTFSQNSANRDGGGIYNLDGLTALNSVTIFGNRADADGDGMGTGGGIWTFNDDRTFTFLFNTIIIGNVQGTQSAPNDIANKNVEAGSTNNLIGDPGSAGGLVNGRVESSFNLVGDGNGNPLAPNAVLDTTLRNNGGPTQTHALIPGSRAINSGRVVDGVNLASPSGVNTKGRVQQPGDEKVRTGRDDQDVPVTGDPIGPGGVEIEVPTFDQRGPFFFRITGGQIDIGAFEVQFHIDLTIGSGGGVEGQVVLMDSQFRQQQFDVLTPYTVLDPNPATQGEPPLIFRGSVRVALGDVNGDGFNEIITAPGAGGGPHVRVFDGRTFELLNPPFLSNFFAYDPRFAGGVFVAAGDLDNDGKAEIITGAGEGGGPHVRAWSGDGTLMFDFFAYNPLFLGGVRVAAGDINGNGTADIITGAGPGGGPHVRVFEGSAPALAAAGTTIGGPLGNFFAYEPTYTGGVFVAANNTGLPGGVQIVTGSGHKIGGATVGLFSTAGVSYFQTPIFAGVIVATFDFNHDGRNDYVTTTGPTASGEIIIFSGDTTQPPASTFGLLFGPQLLSLFPFGDLYLDGLFVAAATAEPLVPPIELAALDSAFASLIDFDLE